MYIGLAPEGRLLVGRGELPEEITFFRTWLVTAVVRDREHLWKECYLLILRTLLGIDKECTDKEQRVAPDG